MKRSFQRFRIYRLFVLAVSIVFLSAWSLNAQYSIYSGQVPGTTGTDGDYELGTRFTALHPAEITAIRFYRAAGETGAHTGKIWSSGPSSLIEVAFSAESVSPGWQTAVLPSPLRIEPNTTYIVSVNANTAYPMTEGGFNTPISNDLLRGEMGVFNNNRNEFPSETYNNSSYFVDIVASRLDQIFTNQVPEATWADAPSSELGLKFTVSSAAKVRYIRFYKVALETGSHTGNLWDQNGNKIASVAFPPETPEAGWKYAELTDNVYLSPGQTYTVSVNCNTNYGGTPHGTDSEIKGDILTAIAGNGVYNLSKGYFPENHPPQNPNYFRDIVVMPLSAPTAPVLTSPANNSAGASIEPLLRWGAVAGVTSYTLEIAENPGFTANLRTFTGITSNSFTVTGLSNSKTYYWRVKGMNGDIPGAWSAVFQFTTINFTNVVLTYPIGGTKVYTEAPSLSWYVPTGGAGWKYDLIYSIDPNFATAITVSNLTVSQYTLQGLQAGKTYYWKIRLKASTGAVVGYSVKESFISFGEALKPVASWPTGDATVYSLSQELYWYINGMSTGLTYELEIRQGGLTALQNIPTNTGITEMHFNATGLQAGKQYSWHVRSRTAAGVTSDWSVAASFRTAGSTVTLLVPVASWPSGSTVVYTTTPGLYWYLVGSSEGLTFEVEIVKANVSFTGNPTKDNITSLSYVTAPLLPGEDYKWQVRSSDGVNHSAWSSPAAFKVAGTTVSPLVVPTCSWPKGEALVYSSEVTLSWYTATASTGLTYEIQYGTAPLTDLTPIVSNIENMYYILTDLQPGATYKWRVRSVSGSNHSNWSATQLFKTVNNAPVATQPVISWPVGGTTVYTNSPVLFWFLNSASTGLTYEVSYSTSSSMAGAIVHGGITQTQYQLTNLTPGATYYWKVRSYDGHIYSAPSSVGSFAVYAGSAAVVPLAGSPIQGIQTGSISPVLSWFIPTSGDVQSYIVEYSKKSDMSEPVSMEVKGNSVALNKLSAESSYYWRVLSLNSKGEKSAFSEVQSFSTSSVTGVEESEAGVPSEFALEQNYPNPFNPATRIEFSIAKDGFYSLEVYNILGQKVTSLMQGNMKAGIYKANFNARDLMSGIYFYRLSGDGVMMVKKMMLVK